MPAGPATLQRASDVPFPTQPMYQRLAGLRADHGTHHEHTRVSSRARRCSIPTFRVTESAAPCMMRDVSVAYAENPTNGETRGPRTED